MNNNDIAKEWFETADLDYGSALFLLEMKPMPFEIICYHCQQCAEKYLKGFIAYYGEDILKTHDLVVLNKRCIDIDDRFIEIEEACIQLTDYGVHIRYPFHIETNEYDVKQAIVDANVIKGFILEIIQEDEQDK
jgi:HEPN domain-containing protein